MTDEQEREFIRLIALGNVRVDVMDGLRRLIDTISDASYERGVHAGASPFDGSWPSQVAQ